MLKPIETQSRQVKSLNGIWRFRADPDGIGEAERWFGRELPDARDMPVPASYNDIVPDAELRDHVGDVWYQTTVWPPSEWADRRVVLRFDGAAHRATVWVNGAKVASHHDGFTPFETDVTRWLDFGVPNRITVELDNRLSLATVPPGRQRATPAGQVRQELTAEYFHYSGLHRDVCLYTTPAEYIVDVTVTTRLDGATGLVDYRIATSQDGDVRVELRDADGEPVAEAAGGAGTLAVSGVRPWRPGEGYLYRLGISCGADEYELPVGIRTVEVVGREFLVNGEPFTFKGVARHEDALVRGRGYDDVVMVHDLALIEWLGANSLRTSHYPHAEAVLDYADRHGLLVIDETCAGMLNLAMDFGPGNGSSPGTFGPDGFGDAARDACTAAVRAMIDRDKNHPSVVMWCLSSQPDAAAEGAREFIEPVVAAARSADPTRPVCHTNVFLAPVERDRITDLFDVVCLNRYQGWYLHGGDTASAELTLKSELDDWADRFDKPILITECGAEALPGLHDTVATMWTEEYQSEVLALIARVAAAHPAVVGQHVWNFADFRTVPGVMAPGGNRKGLFGLDRKPKNAAFTMRRLWTA
ncbi:MAG: beta-glucuronidase [Stackebrandtia sp.]